MNIMNKLRLLATSGVVALALTCAGTAAAQSVASSDAVFRDLGGKPGITKIVAEFLPLVLADARIKDSFKDTDIERLAVLLEEQFCELSGGPCKYSGKDMKTIHEDLNVTNSHFNALAENLQIAMEKVGIPSRTQNKLVARLAPMQRDIVTK